MTRRSSARGRRTNRSASSGTRVVRYVGAATFFALMAAIFAASLRFPLPERPAQWLRFLPESMRELAEFAPLPGAARAGMRSSLAEIDADVVPIDHLVEALSVDVASLRPQAARLGEAATILARAKAPYEVKPALSDKHLFLLGERFASVTEMAMARKGLIVLPGERLRLVLPLERKETHRIGMRVRCLGATADRLDAPARGQLASGLPGATPEERPIELSARGQASWIDVEGKPGSEITVTWPESAPGFLLVEGWRRGSLDRAEPTKSQRGLLLVTVDALTRDARGGSDTNGPEDATAPSSLPGLPSLTALPKTLAVLERLYGKGNVARFTRVMPSSTDADEALAGLLTGRGHGDVPLDRTGPEGLFVTAARAGLPSLLARVETTVDAPRALAPGVGEPQASLRIPRRAEIGGAIKGVLADQAWDAPRFSVVRVRFPAGLLAPTWRAAVDSPPTRLPVHMGAGLAAAIGVAPPAALAWTEKQRQIDAALAEALEEIGLEGKNDFALTVLEGSTGATTAAGTPAPPPAGYVWYASRAWGGAAPDSDALASLPELHDGFERLVAGHGDATGTLAALASRAAPHTVTATERGVWHLFPFGKVLLPDRASGALFSRAQEAPFVWDVPLNKTRETQAALAEPKALKREHALHLFFPPGKAQERVSASLLWNLQPARCGVMESAEPPATGSGAQVRGVVEKDKEKGGWRLWFTGVSSAERGLHVVCAFTGDPRGASLVEMHFERGSQSLPLSAVGLGEFAMPLPAMEEGVQLAQARYDEFYPLLSAEFAPSWRALEGYRLLLWEDPSPGAALAGLADVDLQRRDKETTEGASGAAGEALPQAIRSEAQRRRFAGESP